MSDKANVDPNTGAIIMDLSPASKAWLEELVLKAVNQIAMLSPRQPINPPRDTGGQRSSTPRTGGPTNFPNYGRSKGAPIAGASVGDLEYYANGARKSLADPAKAKWHANERALLDAIEAEQARQGGQPARPAQSSDPFGAPPPGFGDPQPGPGDDDIPF